MTRLADKPKMGRTLNHLEDLVFFYGSTGVAEAIDILTDMTTEANDLSIKWDGKVALYYGRDTDGIFQMGTIGNWSKNTPCQTQYQMFDHIMTTGNGEDFRPQMARDLRELFKYLEHSVPTTFRGFVKGDLLFSPVQSPKIVDDGTTSFTPNQVTYTVDNHTVIGAKVSQAMCGIALHCGYDSWGSTRSTVMDACTVTELCSDLVLTTGQTYVSAVPKVNSTFLSSIQILIATHGDVLDNVIAKRTGLSDIPNIIYTFNNQTMRNGGDMVDTGVFFEWLAGSKVSINKQKKLVDMNDNNPSAFPILFCIFNTIAETKNNIIAQLDQANTAIRASTNGVTGGEGYVSLKHNVKLVPRTKWRPS